MTLAPPVAATAASLGLDAAERVYEPSRDEATRVAAQVSIWLAIGQTKDVQRLRSFASWRDVRDATGPILTDDYADLLRVLRVGSL